MKLKHLFATLSLAIVAGAGVAAGVSSGNNTQPVKADDAGADTTIYFDLNDVASWWYTDGGTTKVWIVDNGSGSWSNTLNRIESSHYYYFTLPKNYDTFVIVRSTASEGEWTNQTNDIYYNDSFNYIHLNNSDGKYKTVKTCYAADIRANEKIYLTIDNYNYDWFGAEAHTTLHFYNNAEGTALDIDAGTRIGNTIEFSINDNYFAEGVIAVRHGGNFDPSNWDATVWNQSVNMTYSISNKNVRGYVVKTLTGQYASEAGFDALSVDYFAKAFSCYFLEKTNGYCESSIEDNIASIQSAFNDLDAKWAVNGGVAGEVKSAFLNAEITRGKDGSYFGNNYTAQAISRYANLVEGNYTTAFLGTYSGASGAIVPMIVEEKSKYTVAIVFASLIALTAVGGFFFIRRKRV